MSTAMGDWFSFVLYGLMVVLTVGTAARVRPGTESTTSAGRAPSAVWTIVAASSVAGLIWYDAFAREPAAIEHGQVWRLVTSVAVQDGGVVGTLGNLVALAYVLRAASRVWSGATAAALFVVGALVFNLPATFVWDQAGGGNSGATLFLAGTVLTGLLVQRIEIRPSAAAAAAALVIGIVMLARADAHGEAVATGLAAGALVGALAGRLERGAVLRVRSNIVRELRSGPCPA